jgi:hypothetical protein
VDDGREMAGELAGGVRLDPGVRGAVTAGSLSGCVRFRGLKGGSVIPGVHCTVSENPRVGGSIPSLAVLTRVPRA